MIRPALPEDAAGLGAMHAASWAESFSGFMPEGLMAVMTDPAQRGAAWAAIFARPLLPGGTLIAEDGNAIVGFVSVCPARDPALTTAGEVSGLYVLRRAQGRGIATALLHAGFGMLSDAGHADAGAWCVLGNAPAERFYAARGAIPGPHRVEHRGPHALHETGWLWRSLT